MTRTTKVLVQLAVVSASLLCCLGHLQTVYYQYAVRFLYEENCNSCTSECVERVSQCANLEFHYFNVTVLSHTQNCTARVMRLLLELKQAKRNDGDSVYLNACVNGMNKYQFWNYLECSSITERDGRETDFINCKPNEILSPGVSTTVLPNWVPSVLTVLAGTVVIVLLAICVVSYQFYRNRAGRADAQERVPPRVGVVPGPYERIESSASPAPSPPSSFKQWLTDRRPALVRCNWFRPTPRTPPVTYERERPRGSSTRSEQRVET